MKPLEFTTKYRASFGDCAPLPIAVIYSDTPMGDTKSVSGCMFKRFHKAANGKTVSFSVDNFSCGGGKLYLGLGPTPKGVFNFVSSIEKYKLDQSTAKQSIDFIGASMSEKPYINFVRIDNLTSFDDIEGLIFFVSPDVLSGLFTWANYDSDDLNAVMSPWGSGCSTTVTSMVNENRLGGKHCFLGLFDVSARPYFRPEILSFAIPKSRFNEMYDTLDACCVSGAPAWLKVKKRINYKN